MDDVAAIGEFNQPDALDPQIFEFSRIIRYVMGIHGFLLNQAKSGFLIAAFCDLAKGIYQRIRVTLGGVMQIASDNLPLIDLYKHLGGMVTYDGSMRPETSVRVRRHSSVLAPLKRLSTKDCVRH